MSYVDSPCFFLQCIFDDFDGSFSRSDEPFRPTHIKRFFKSLQVELASRCSCRLGRVARRTRARHWLMRIRLGGSNLGKFFAEGCKNNIEGRESRNARLHFFLEAERMAHFAGAGLEVGESDGSEHLPAVPK